jgi:hypothetical protein
MFVRNFYDKDIETKYFEPLLAEIERIRSGLASMPTETSLNFIKNSAMQRWLEEGGHEKIVGTVIFEIFNRLQFSWLSNIFKTISLIDALELMYNAKNYLGWVLEGRLSSNSVPYSITTPTSFLALIPVVTISQSQN